MTVCVCFGVSELYADLERTLKKKKKKTGKMEVPGDAFP